MPVLTIAAVLVGVVVLATLAYFTYAYARYHRVRPQARPCRDPAHSIQVDGFALFVRVVGTDRGRPPVVALHGGPGHSSLSFKQGLDFLASDRRVLLYDQRGSGLSEVRAGAEQYTIDRLVDEVEHLRRDVLQAETIVLLGHSAGGALAQHYALRHADRLDRLVLVGSTSANNSLRPGVVWRTLGPGLYATQLGMPPAGPDEADAWFATTQLDGDTRRLFDPARTDVITDSGPLTFTTWFAVSQSLAGDAHDDQLRRVDVPTLIVYGEADSPYTGEPTAQRLHDLLPRSRTVRVARSGHWPFLENPDDFRAAVEPFLES